MKKKIMLISVVLFVVDQVSKLLIDHFLPLGKSYRICEKFLYITKAYNSGVSFSMLTNHRFLIIILNLLIMLFLYFYLKKFKENKRNIIAFGMIFGGLFGNLVDRFVYGYVIDFIDFYIFNYNYPIFNLADSFICIGIFLLLYAIIMGEDNEKNHN